jgi:Protein of unknown function (DUF4058)
MPLLDHFHGSNLEELPWESVNTLWIAAVVANLNQMLPQDRFRAFAKRHLGPQVEADVAEFESIHSTGSANGAVATLMETYAPPALVTAPAIFPDDIEVQIADANNRRRLVAVIEFVSPGNKKETDERNSFVAKCCTYLRQGIGLVVVDVVTSRTANLHDELMRFMGLQAPYLFTKPTPIYAVSYRPIHRPSQNAIDLWPEALEVGASLPTVPLPLKGAGLVPLDLEATYGTALEQSGA